MSSKISETYTYLCPLGGICRRETERLRRYAAFLERLAENNSSDIFLNGGISEIACPGHCGTIKQRKATIAQCRAEGTDPEVLLAKLPMPLWYKNIIAIKGMFKKSNGNKR